MDRIGKEEIGYYPRQDSPSSSHGSNTIQEYHNLAAMERMAGSGPTSLSIAQNEGKTGMMIEDMTNLDESGLKRDLQLRHMVMIAISGTIGTGLFLTSGKTIATAGPLGALSAYIVIGVCLVFVCQAIGEIATLLPLPGAFTVWGTLVFDEAFSFQMTWLYFVGWALTIPAELSASSLIVSYWLPKDSAFPEWMVPKAYGEIEYWFSILKVVTIVVFIICGVLVDAGAVGGHVYGVENWQIPGAPFKGGFNAFVSVLVTVGFAYGGTELSGVTAAESRNPHKHVPKAVNTVLLRIAFFYILSVFFLGSIIPNDDPRLANTDGSVLNAPFTIVFLKAGMRGGASYMNAVIFTSVLSAANSDFYVSTRMLMSLSRNGWAPAIVGRTNSRGVPVLAVIITTAFASIALVMIYTGAAVVFDWLVVILGSMVFNTWICILFLHFRFRACWKAQGRRADELPYQSWGYPYGHYLATLIALGCVVASFYLSIISKPEIGSNGADDPTYKAARDLWIQTLIGAWLPWLLMALLYFGYKWAKGTKVVSLEEADLDTGRWSPPQSLLEEEAEASRRPVPIWRRALAKIS
ncbi:hypothetical protein BGW38_007332 [Lunasporangiospora selenospora]|uniref:Amino acid permease/ SLC12A domain-containing protein n=1 Tax=Lunasporangiospora selenospora TaxID=979761 RepID=A0A9P6FZ95_9FUNG|nr:hypothetical protein BGW38_007332 [Lunasporangiospora selenospora]